MFGSLFGKTSQEKLLFVPNANTNPKEKHEICEPALFRFLLNEKTIEDQAEIQKMLKNLNCIDKLSKITEIEIHKSSMGSLKDLGRAFHFFIVFKSSGKDEDYWWSLEKNRKYIVLQRSSNKNDVRDKLYGEKRKKVKSIEENLVGKGSIKDLFVIVWAYQAITEKYHIIHSNCQSLVTLISKNITEIEYKFKGYFEYSTKENDRNVKMLDLINILSMSFERKGHPLFNLIYYEKPILFDKVMESGNYDINDIFTDHRITTLHLAIVISSLEMVRHLLEECNVDPTIRDRKGRTALHLAALYAQENVEQIIDLLLEHIKVDERDLYNGRTALHYAVSACNSIAVQHLIDKGADLDSIDKHRLFPLHLAACHEKGTEIVDLILRAKKSKQKKEGIDDSVYQFGITALHMAVTASNETTADYLIKRGADINYRDTCGRTPLHLAVAFTQDMKIIEFLLKHIEKEDVEKHYKNDENILDYAEKNENGLGHKIIARLRTRGIFGKKKDPTFSGMEDKSNKKSEETVASKEKTEKEIETIIRETKNEIAFFETFRETKRIFSNGRQNKKLSADTEVAFDTQIKKMLPLALATALENLIIESDVEKVQNLKDEGKDISKVTWENGENALHVAAKWAKTREIIDVIQENGKFNINGVDNKGYTPLHYALLGTNPTIDHEAAVNNKDIDLFDLFLKPEKVDIIIDKSERTTRLMNERNESNLTTTRYLIEKGADPNIAIKGWTPFLLAAKYAKDINIFRLFLVNNTVDVNCINNNGYNALLTVCQDYNEENLIDIVRLLIEKNIDVHCKTDGGSNALTFLCQFYKQENLIDIVRLLIEKNIDVNCKNNNGWNALHTVCRYYDKENLIDIVRLLIEKNIDVNCKQNDGWNALHLVCYYYSKSRLVDLVRLLVQYKIDKKVKTTGGEIGTSRSFLLKRFKEEEVKDVLQILDS